MIDVGMCADDLFCRQTVMREPIQYPLQVIARIDDDRFARLLVAEDCAITLKPSDWECFDDHFTSSAPTTFNVPCVAAPRLLKSTLATSCSSPGGSFCRTANLSRSRMFPLSSKYVASS